MSFIYIADGIDDVLAVHLNQYADAWTGVSGKGQPLNLIAVNDPINFAASVRNLDPTNSRVLQLLKADGTVLFQCDASGVKVSPDGTVASVPATLTGTQAFTNKSFSFLAGQGNTLTVPAVRANRSVVQGITTSVLSAITFDQERYKTDAAMHSNATNPSRLTATVAGKYRISGHVSWAASAAGTFRALYVRLNGTTIIASDQRAPVNSATVSTDMSITTEYIFALNDYVELLVNQDSGGTLNIQSTSAYSAEFAMSFVSA